MRCRDRLVAGLIAAVVAAAAPGAHSAKTGSSQPRLPSLSAGQGAGKSLEVIEKALLSRDYFVRLLAIEVLGRISGSEPWLQYCLGDPEHDARMAAVEALRQLATTAAIELLRTVRDDKTEDLDIRALAASALLERRITTRGQQ